MLQYFFFTTHGYYSVCHCFLRAGVRYYTKCHKISFKNIIKNHLIIFFVPTFSPDCNRKHVIFRRELGLMSHTGAVWENTLRGVFVWTVARLSILLWNGIAARAMSSLHTQITGSWTFRPLTPLRPTAVHWNSTSQHNNARRRRRQRRQQQSVLSVDWLDSFAWLPETTVKANANKDTRIRLLSPSSQSPGEGLALAPSQDFTPRPLQLFVPLNVGYRSTPLTWTVMFIARLIVHSVVSVIADYTVQSTDPHPIHRHTQSVQSTVLRLGIGATAVPLHVADTARPCTFRPRRPLRPFSVYCQHQQWCLSIGNISVRQDTIYLAPRSGNEVRLLFGSLWEQLYSVSEKSHPFYISYNLVRCYPIWQKLTATNFTQTQMHSPPRLFSYVRTVPCKI